MPSIISSRILNKTSAVCNVQGLSSVIATLRSSFHTTQHLDQRKAGRQKPSIKCDKPLTHEQANKPDQIGHRKSFNTSSLNEGSRKAECAHEDILIRKFRHGSCPDMLASEATTSGAESTSKDAKKGKGKPYVHDLVMPPIKPHYELEPDFSEVRLTHYEDDLIDPRSVKLRGNKEMRRMTDWRKSYFEKRLRRTLPAPISLRNMNDTPEVDVFSQRVDNKDLARRCLSRKDMIDSDYEKTLKHHNLLQYLLGSEFTDDPIEYDEEAKAWTDMMWHRSYGHEDGALAFSEMKCKSCFQKLHSCDRGLSGYVPKQLLMSLVGSSEPINCQRCQFAANYKVSLESHLSPAVYSKVIMSLQNKPNSLVILVVDLTDFPRSIWPGILDLVGLKHRVLVVGNKLDLLPYDGPGMLQRVTRSLRATLGRIRLGGEKQLNLIDVLPISARTGFGIEGLASRLLSLNEDCDRDIYLVGNSNTGKATLFSALLQSDLCASREGDLLSRVSGYQFHPDEDQPMELPTVNDINLLRFPIARLEGWELALKKRKSIRVERDERAYERSFLNSVKFRQKTTPHFSSIIDRIAYPPAQPSICDSQTDSSNSSPTSMTSDNRLVVNEKLNEDKRQLRLSSDHPMRNHQADDGSAVHQNVVQPLGGTKAVYHDHAFLHYTPSSSQDMGGPLEGALTNKERLLIRPNEVIVPRKYSLRPLQSIFIAGLARLDLLTSTSSVIIVIFASRYLPTHVLATRKADQFYSNFVGTPYLGVPLTGESPDQNKEAGTSGPQQLTQDDASRTSRALEWPPMLSHPRDWHVRGRGLGRGAADIVLGLAGWAMVNTEKDQECIVRAYTAGGQGIHFRHEPVAPFAASMVSGKLRDTPIFRDPNFLMNHASIS